MKNIIYQVIDNDTCIFKGTAREIRKNISPSFSPHCYVATGYKLGGKYKVIPTNEYKDEERIINKQKNNRSKENVLEYLIKHLRKYGNTIVKGSPETYINDLKKVGIEITYHQSIYDKKWYIVEVVNGSN